MQIMADEHHKNEKKAEWLKYAKPENWPQFLEDQAREEAQANLAIEDELVEEMDVLETDDDTSEYALDEEYRGDNVQDL